MGGPTSFSLGLLHTTAREHNHRSHWTTPDLQCTAYGKSHRFTCQSWDLLGTHASNNIRLKLHSIKANMGSLFPKHHFIYCVYRTQNPCDSNVVHIHVSTWIKLKTLLHSIMSSECDFQCFAVCSFSTFIQPAIDRGYIMKININNCTVYQGNIKRSNMIYLIYQMAYL